MNDWFDQPTNEVSKDERLLHARLLCLQVCCDGFEVMQVHFLGHSRLFLITWIRNRIRKIDSKKIDMMLQQTFKKKPRRAQNSQFEQRNMFFLSTCYSLA